MFIARKIIIPLLNAKRRGCNILAIILPDRSSRPSRRYNVSLLIQQLLNIRYLMLHKDPSCLLLFWTYIISITNFLKKNSLLYIFHKFRCKLMLSPVNMLAFPFTASSEKYFSRLHVERTQFFRNWKEIIKMEVNNSIKCGVHDCKHHAGNVEYCTLNCVSIGACECSPKTKEGTDCESFAAR